MRWRWVVVAMIVGGLAAAWWFLLHWHQSGKPAEAPEQSEGQIPLMVRHNGSQLELRWSTDDQEIESANDGDLTITDGKYQSKLKLDQAELRSGAAYYWPRADRVSFKLETDEGAWGSVEVPAWEVQTDEPVQVDPDAKRDGQQHRATPPAGKKVAKTVRAKRGKHGSTIPQSWKTPAE